jgi:putative metallohydrolase (TIGR04338 family)
MQQQDPRVDRCAGAVYQAEDTLGSVMARPHRQVRVGREILTLPEQLTFGTVEAIQAFVDAVLDDPGTTQRYPGRGPVSVRVKRGFRSATYREGTIHIPAADRRGRWALSRSVVLHEVAHHLAGEPGHGTGFRAALLHLHERHVGAAAAALLAHLFAPLDALPDPQAATRGDDPGADQVRRVTALLAKAEATTSPEEAEAYLAKAALVAQRHSIDVAVAAMRPSAVPTAPTHRMLTIGAPRRVLNSLLVSLYVQVARAWGVRVDIGHGSTYVVGYGMPADLDQVESVFATASALMATRAQEHVRAGAWRGTTYRVPGQPGSRPVKAAVARNAFCLGFIERLGQRIGEAARQARAAEHDAGAGAPPAPAGRPSTASVELALRARDLAVADHHRRTSRARGTWRGSSSSAGSASASRRAGHRAAEEYGRREVGARRRAISS